MAISFITSANSTNATFNVTINSGGERIVLVGVSSPSSDAAINVTGITFGGTAMTKVRDDKIVDTIRGEIWYLLNPRMGLSSVVVTHSTFGNVAYSAIVLGGVAQSGQPDAQAGTTAASGSTSIGQTITTVANDSWIVEYLSLATAGVFTMTPQDGQTQRSSAQNTSVGRFYTNPTTTAGGYTEDYNTSTQDKTLSLASFSPSADLGIGVFDAISITESVTVAPQVVQVVEFKDSHSSVTDEWEATWEGQSTVATSTQSVLLQIYNVTSGLWETVDTDSGTAANTDFTLSHTMLTGFSDYYDTNHYVTYRVYQTGSSTLSTDYWNVTWTSGASQINVNDAISVSEFISMEVINRISVSDTVTIAESVSVSPVSFINVNDTVTVAESVNVAQVYTINVNDSITVTDVVINLDYSQNISVFDAVYVWEGRNIIGNYSFESDTPGSSNMPAIWNGFGNTGIAYKGVANDFASDGDNSFKISDPGIVDCGIRQNLTGLVAGKTYIISVWAKSTSDVTNGSFVISNEQNGSGGAQTTTNNWSGEFEGRREITWTPTTTSWEIFLGQGAFGPATAGTTWFDDIQISVFEKVEITSNVSVSDTVTVVDAPTLFVPHLAINVFDTVSIIEFFDPENVLSVTAIDTITVTDVPTVTNTQLGGISVFDSVSVAEFVQLTEVDNITVNDTISVSEQVVMQVNGFINVNDSITVAESVSLNRISNVSVFDAITVTDVPTVTATQLGGINVNDTVSIAEFVQMQVTSFINVNDLVTIEDIGIMGTPGGGFLVSDTISVSEFVNVSIVNNVSVFDTVSVAEFTQLAYTSAIFVNDTVSITEFIKVERTSNISVFDAITVADVPTLFLPHLAINVFDTVSIIEFFDPENVLSVTAVDTITVSEFVAIQNEALGDITISDNINVTEFVRIEVTNFIAVSDDITVDDVATPGLVSGIYVSDTVNVVELIYEAGIISNISVFDSVSVAEFVQGIPLYGVSVEDSITVTDVVTNITNTQLGGINVMDVVMITEFAGVTEALHAFTFDTITVTDVVTNIGYVIYKAPKFIFVDGQLCMLIVEATIPHYTRL